MLIICSLLGLLFGVLRLWNLMRCELIWFCSRNCLYWLWLLWFMLLFVWCVDW